MKTRTEIKAKLKEALIKAYKDLLDRNPGKDEWKDEFDDELAMRLENAYSNIFHTYISNAAKKAK
jgi:hypothetical protein